MKILRQHDGDSCTSGGASGGSNPLSHYHSDMTHEAGFEHFVGYYLVDRFLTEEVERISLTMWFAFYPRFGTEGERFLAGGYRVNLSPTGPLAD